MYNYIRHIMFSSPAAKLYFGDALGSYIPVVCESKAKEQKQNTVHRILGWSFYWYQLGSIPTFFFEWGRGESMALLNNTAIRAVATWGVLEYQAWTPGRLTWHLGFEADHSWHAGNKALFVIIPLMLPNYLGLSDFSPLHSQQFPNVSEEVDCNSQKLTLK